MKANARYTVRELMKKAGLNPNYLGKKPVTIGGIRGIHDPEKIILIQKGTKELIMSDGVKRKKVAFNNENSVLVSSKEVIQLKEREAQLGK